MVTLKDICEELGNKFSWTPVIAFDFDGTLCDSNYPECGEPNMEIVDTALYCMNLGYTLILWTCREGESLQKAIDWCKDYGIEFDAVNDNCETNIKLFGNGRKIFADLYIDDKSLNPFR